MSKQLTAEEKTLIIAKLILSEKGQKALLEMAKMDRETDQVWADLLQISYSL
jgi:hypothetical protein